MGNRFIPACLALVICLSCATEEQEEEVVEEPMILTEVKETSIKDDTELLKGLSYLERKYLPLSELYGKFFQDRIQFHILEDPDLTLYKTKVKELTFYHIDNELSKKKFIMEGDISGDLMTVLGKFKLKPLDSLSLIVAQSETIIHKTAAGKAMNEGITNYEMRWEKDDRTIRFRASPQTDGQMAYVYSEEVPDYKFLLQSVQTGLKVYVDPDIIEEKMEQEAQQQSSS
ncbi:MAG: hypothetical protein AAGA85_21870 [Bacteroidota bacterium]